MIWKDVKQIPRAKCEIPGGAENLLDGILIVKNMHGMNSINHLVPINTTNWQRADRSLENNTHVKMINKYQILVGKPLKKRPLGTTRLRGENVIKISVSMNAWSE
jgi:hypothetical protein